MLVICCFAQATVFNVPDDAATIKDAVFLCMDGDTIELTSNMTYTGWGNRDIRTYGKKITIRSEDPSNGQVVANTVIDCEGLGRAFALDMAETADTVVSGITMRNGNGGPVNLLGGALYFSYDSRAVVSNCIIENSSASFGGAIAISNSGSSPTIKNCQIMNNIAVVGGGAVYINGGEAIIENCVISNNAAPRGGALYSHNPGTPVLSHCTIVGNAAESNAGAIYSFNASNLILYGCILWDNVAETANQMQIGGIGMPTTVQISYCDVQGMDDNIVVYAPSVVEWGEGNIEADPMFGGAEAVSMSAVVEGGNVISDFSLDKDSPCVDMGDNGYNGEGQTDVYGLQRVFGEAVDIGASEFVADDLIEARVRLWPKVINLRGKQNWFFCTIKMDGYETSEIDLESILLQGVVEPVWSKKLKRVKELVVRFKMREVRQLVDESQDSITLSVTGVMNNGVPFEGTDKVKVYRNKGKGHDKHDETLKKGKGHHKHEDILKKVKELKDKHKKD